MTYRDGIQPCSSFKHRVTHGYNFADWPRCQVPGCQGRTSMCSVCKQKHHEGGWGVCPIVRSVAQPEPWEDE